MGIAIYVSFSCIRGLVRPEKEARHVFIGNNGEGARIWRDWLQSQLVGLMGKIVRKRETKATSSIRRSPASWLTVHAAKGRHHFWIETHYAKGIREYKFTKHTYQMCVTTLTYITSSEIFYDDIPSISLGLRPPKSICLNTNQILNFYNYIIWTPFTNCGLWTLPRFLHLFQSGVPGPGVRCGIKE